jgi:H+/gluconate symporter-like permease
VPTGRPGILTALTPIVLVIVLNYLFSRVILPWLDTSFLALPEYGATNLEAVKGIWAIIAALAFSILLVMALNWRRFSNFSESLDSGADASVMPIFNTASLVGFGAVIALLPSFASIAAGILTLGGDNPLISLSLSVGVLAGITGSASGGMSIVLQTMGANFADLAAAAGVSLDLMHRVTALAAGGLDCLPHGGAVITLLQICNLNHRQSYLDIFMVSVAGPVMALIAVIILGSVLGSF